MPASYSGWQNHQPPCGSKVTSRRLRLIGNRRSGQMPAWAHFLAPTAGIGLTRLRGICFTIFPSASRSASGPLSSPSSDFSRNAKAPSACNRSAFFWESPVQTITGISAVAGSCLRAWSTSSPVTFGSNISSRTRSGSPSRAISRACSPSMAVLTS